MSLDVADFDGDGDHDVVVGGQTLNTPTEHGYFYLKMLTVAVDNGVSMFCILVMNIMMAPSP